MSSELLKLKRTLVWPGVLAAPLVTALLAWLAQRERNAGQWDAFLLNGELIWALLSMPMLIALLASQLTGVEHTSGSWRMALTLPQPRWRLYLRKAGLLLLLTLAANLLLVGGMVLAGEALPYALEGSWTVQNLLGDALKLWVSGFAVALILLALAFRFSSFLAPSGVGTAATIAGFFVVDSVYGRWWPWSLGGYVVAPSEMRGGGPTVPELLVYSAAVALVALLLGVWSFSRRDH
ncbi:hypothetical protein HNR42_001907 [Deinobacterium chartae]|uniref:ABC-2 type transport system permease protein n=1 Tax=Deinobacterium chartae TaxID=521158 RepID=A0A841HZV5_9DEIO|nr:ABC transporter permease [Deinobacterium chartae]MBB6098473.1 hypothetical protein [Deinobacterium chartae]